MTAIKLSKYQTPGFGNGITKPVIPVKIDWDNKIAKQHLYDVFMFDSINGYKSLANIDDVGLVGSATNEPMHTTTGPTNGMIDLGVIPISSWNGATFILKFGNVTGENNANSRGLSIWDTNSDDVRIFHSATDTFKTAWDDGSATTYTMTVDESADNVIAISHNGSTQKTYLNGVLKDSSADTFNFSAMNNGDLTVGRTAFSTLYALYASYHYLFVFKDDLDEVHVENLYHKPFQLLKPRIDSFVITSSAAGGPWIIQLGKVTETGLVKQLTSAKLKSLGKITELDTLKSVTPMRNYSLGLVTETDLLKSLSSLKVKDLGLVSGIDVVKSISASASVPIGLVTALDVVNQIDKIKTKDIGKITGIDNVKAVSLLAGVPIGIVTETGLVKQLTSAKLKSLGKVTGLGVVNSVTLATGIPIGKVTGLDVIKTLDKDKKKSIGIVNETDIVNSVSSDKLKQLGLITETGQPLSLSVEKAVSLGIVTETDLIKGILQEQIISLGQVTETDTVLALVTEPEIVIEANSIILRAKGKSVILRVKDKSVELR